MSGIKAGDELKIVIGATGIASSVSVNGQILDGVNWLEIRVAGGELTTIKLEMHCLGAPMVYEGQFVPLVEP